jgi:putative DNA primase/helicase
MRWATDKAAVLAKAAPEIPPGFHNRRRANWVPLLAIAEAAGGDWKKAGWKAALAIEAVADTFDPSVGVELLRAIKSAFEARETDRITSAGLINDLVADETARWATYNKGKSISQRQVASLLKAYVIKPKTIRLDDGSTAKGYLVEWFTDAFSASVPLTLPKPQVRSVTPSQTCFHKTFRRFHPSQTRSM